MSKTAAILGAGAVGATLAGGLAARGWHIVVGREHPDQKLNWEGAWAKSVEVSGYEQAARKADLVVLAVKGSAAEAVVRTAAPGLAGKTVLDATNPIAETPPVNGVLRFFTTLDRSLMERVQALAPEAHFVKAFNSVGLGLMVEPGPKLGRDAVRPSMFICGNHAAAKREVANIVVSFGWEVEDMGAIEAARAIEPLCMLWCIPAMRDGEFAHAFKMLRK